MRRTPGVTSSGWWTKPMSWTVTTVGTFRRRRGDEVGGVEDVAVDQPLDRRERHPVPHRPQRPGRGQLALHAHVGPVGRVEVEVAGGAPGDGEDDHLVVGRQLGDGVDQLVGVPADAGLAPSSGVPSKPIRMHASAARRAVSVRPCAAPLPTPGPGRPCRRRRRRRRPPRRPVGHGGRRGRAPPVTAVGAGLPGAACRALGHDGVAVLGEDLVELARGRAPAAGRGRSTVCWSSPATRCTSSATAGARRRTSRPGLDPPAEGAIDLQRPGRRTGPSGYGCGAGRARTRSRRPPRSARRRSGAVPAGWPRPCSATGTGDVTSRPETFASGPRRAASKSSGEVDDGVVAEHEAVGPGPARSA